MKKLLLLTGFLTVMTASLMAQTSFIPPSWSYNSTTGVYTQGDNLTMYKHELSSQHFDVYYGTGYGDTPPEKLASSNSLYVDVQDLLNKAEIFFDLNINKLKFADLSGTTKLNTYKMIIVLLHDTGWTATGSGYDDKIGALWVTPSTCHPVGQTIAHEIGHAFQYQVHCDLGGYTGFREAVGNGSTFWEQTAQWQSVEAYPELMMSQSIGVWRNSHNYAFTHEWQRYQSYWLHYYWADKYGIDAVGKIWRGAKSSGQDPLQVYMSVFGVNKTKDFYREIFDYACKMVTYDIDEIREYGKNYIGDYTYKYVDVDEKTIQVAYASCPQSTGFNVIPLDVPAAGTKISAMFTALPAGKTALAEGDPAQYLNGDSKYVDAGVTTYNANDYRNRRGFRHGFVALLNDGTRVYESVDTVYATGMSKYTKAVADTTSFVIPEGTQKLWFVVCPTPTVYIVHKWDESITNDDQWPYQLCFDNTDILGRVPKIDLSDETILPKDTVIDVYVGFDPSSSDYSGVSYSMSTKDMRAMGEALRLQPGSVSSLMKTYSASQAKNSIFLLPLNPSTLAPVNKASTANGYGHWFGKTGSVVSYGNTAYVYSEFTPSSLTFNLGQYPGRCKKGDVYTIGQVLQYKDSAGNIGRAKIIFHIYIGGVPTDIMIDDTTEDKTHEMKAGVYNLQGVKVADGCDISALHSVLAPGIYITGGKKILVK